MQDLLFDVSDMKIAILPLKFNCKQFFENDGKLKKKMENLS